jgi:hypothetical protein
LIELAARRGAAAHRIGRDHVDAALDVRCRDGGGSPRGGLRLLGGRAAGDQEKEGRDLGAHQLPVTMRA